MDPHENPSSPKEPGPPASSSQGGFQLSPSPFGVPSFGQNAVGPMFGQSVQFGGSSTVPAEWKPQIEAVFNNPFASAKSTSSIFGGRSAESVGDLADAVKPQTPVVKFNSMEENNHPVAGTSTMLAKPTFPNTLLFARHEQTGGNIQMSMESKTTTEIRQTTVTTFLDTNEKIIGNVPGDHNVAKADKKTEISKHRTVHPVVKDRIRNIISENRTGEDEEELQMKESLLRKLAARKLEKKRKSTDNNDVSPGKITKEDKALYFTLPNEAFTKTLIKDHFSTFGEVSRIYLNTTKNHCIIHFVRHEDACKAYENGSLINGCAVRLFWRNTSRSKKKSESSKEGNADRKKHSSSKKRLLDIDPEVQEELAAMGGLDKYRPLHLSKHHLSSEPVLIRKSSRLKESSKASKKEGSKRTELTSKEAEPQLEKDNDGTAAVFIEATEGAQELIAIMKTPAASLEDRLHILEARDKLIRLGQVRQCDLAKAKKTVGVCPDMCPEKERLLRETRRQVSFYEMDESTKRMNPVLAVKQYARSSADQEEPLPHELRPLPVMAMTMSYLLHCIADLCDRPGENLAEWYHYLWDRTRSIRKEITQQELCDLESVQLVEQCARFHIHCCARLVAEDMSVFDHRINTENLTKCLQTLKHMYYDLWVNHNQTCLNEPEFMSYFLLLNLNNGSVMWELEQLREDVLQTPEIIFAAKLYMAINSNNFVRFFRLVRSASYLASCLAIRYFYQVRTLALRTHIKALNARGKPILYPLTTLLRELAFEDLIQGEHFCAHHGLTVDHSVPDMPKVLFSRNTFRIATTVFAASRSLGLVESKRSGSVGEVIAGGTLPPKTFESHLPHDSFDANGFLKRSAWYAVDQGMAPSDLSFEEEFGNVSEKDSSATPSKVEALPPTTEDPQPIITEPPEDDVRTSPSVFQTPAPQISEVRNDSKALPDVIAPVVQGEPIVETKPVVQQASSGSEITRNFSFSRPSQTTTIFGAATSSTTTWMSQSSTTQFKSVFGVSPKSPPNVFSTSSVPPVQKTVVQSQDVKTTPSIQTGLSSKTSLATSTTGTYSSFGGATTSGFGGVVTTTSFGGSISTGVAGPPKGFSAIKSASSKFGEPTASRIGGSTSIAFSKGTRTVFGGATGSTTTSSSTIGTSVTRSPVGVAAIKNDATKNSSAGKPTSKTPQVDLNAQAAAAKKEAEAKDAEEKMRARLLESRVTRISQDSLDKFVDAEIRLVAEESLKIAKEMAKKEKEEREKRAFELSETLMTEVLLEELEKVVAEERKKAIEEREKAIRRKTAKYFRRWLEKTRLSLSRKRAIENFPAGVSHLSLEEHAKRWGAPSLSRIEDFVKQNGFRARGIPKVAHSWTSLSSLVGKEVMLQYHDQCRQLRWKHSSEVVFKVLISVTSDFNDRSTRVVEWFVRNPQQLKHGSSFEDSKLGVLRYVTTYQLSPGQVVHSSLQLVRGSKALQTHPDLVAGTSAILFSMNLSEDIYSCCDRLEAILEPLADLPAPPFVVVVFGSQNVMDAVTLKSIVSNLGLYKKLRKGSISDYRVLYLKETSDLLTIDCELRKVLSYAAQKWHPPQQFTVKPLRTVLIGAFDMFFISLKCSLDRRQPNSKSINDPQILAELCNEFLKYICAVLLRSCRESKPLCAPEMWPNIYKGAYNRFHNNRSYEQHTVTLLSSMQIPKISGWPPGNSSAFKTWLSQSQSIVSHSTELIDRWSKVSSWPQVLEDIPWIQVFKACMERKFQESEMSGLCGTELYVIVDSKRLEKLHNDPWWNHSRRLHMYLSKFEEAVDSMPVDISNRNDITECPPPLKKVCLGERIVEQSVPDVEEISQIIEDHQQSLRNNVENDSMDQGDVSGPRMSKLEVMIDSIQSRLGIGPYSSTKVVPEPKKVETAEQVGPVRQQILGSDKETKITKETEIVSRPEHSKEADKSKMKTIVEAARKIVAPLQLSSGTSKHQEVVQDFLLGRGKRDLSAPKISLSALSRSVFVERSKREVEQRINLYKRCATPESEEPEDKSESYHDETSNSLSDSTSRDERQNSRRRQSKYSGLSGESQSSVEAYSVTSDEEKSDSDGVRYDEEPMEYDNYEESKEGSIDCEVKMEVVRSSSDAREDEFAEVEENFDGGDEELDNFEEEGEDEDFDEEDDERGRESSESDIKITDDEVESDDEEREFGEEGKVEEREFDEEEGAVEERETDVEEGEIEEATDEEEDEAEEATDEEEDEAEQRLTDEEEGEAKDRATDEEGGKAEERATDEEGGKAEERAADEGDKAEERATDEEGEVEEREFDEDGEAEEYEERRVSSESNVQITYDAEGENITCENRDENLDEEMEGEKYDGEDDSSDVQMISSDEEVNAKRDISDEESNGQSNCTENDESSSDEVVSDTSDY